MGLLGMGNGAVFQLVPQRLPKEIGVIAGIVGAAGGIGGFISSAPSKNSPAASAPGLVGLTCAAGMICVARIWRLATALGTIAKEIILES